MNEPDQKPPVSQASYQIVEGVFEFGEDEEPLVWILEETLLPQQSL